MKRTRKAPAQMLEYGRVTIPKSVRKELELEQGDFVVVSVKPFKGDNR